MSAQPLSFLCAEGGLQRGQVEGHRIGHPPALLIRNVGNHPVLVVPPPGKPGQEFKNPFVIGVENVGAVLVNQHPGLVQTVVGVASDVGPPLQHQHPLPGLRQDPGSDGAGVARAHNQNVKRMLQVTLTSFDGRSGRILCGFSISYFWKNTN